MTRDDVIRMARESSFAVHEDQPFLVKDFERFAALVAAHEREECANTCYVVGYEENAMGEGNGYVAQKCAEAIKARR